ncbi:uncharacterized protein LOC129682555 [Psammomys obesus]|uniref:uncharacterized protein LOC129682555 n=1 Tax=Psammomys obesus TaxID=48139 RepID=UPI002452D36D|nr:uncharacterized protein LOC129682555 [Psammomys obesus]
MLFEQFQFMNNLLLPRLRMAAEGGGSWGGLPVGVLTVEEPREKLLSVVLVSTMCFNSFFLSYPFSSKEVNKKMAPLPASPSGHQIGTERRHSVNTFGGDPMSLVEVAGAWVGDHLLEEQRGVVSGHPTKRVAPLPSHCSLPTGPQEAKSIGFTWMAFKIRSSRRHSISTRLSGREERWIAGLNFKLFFSPPTGDRGGNRMAVRLSLEYLV